MTQGQVKPLKPHHERRQRDPERTKLEILAVATQEFADRGFAGARVDEIAAQTRTTKRMIYYYFGSKELLYIAALEKAYEAIRITEQSVDIDNLDPVAAVRKLADSPSTATKRIRTSADSSATRTCSALSSSRPGEASLGLTDR